MLIGLPRDGRRQSDLLGVPPTLNAHSSEGNYAWLSLPVNPAPPDGLSSGRQTMASWSIARLHMGLPIYIRVIVNWETTVLRREVPQPITMGRSLKEHTQDDVW